MVMLNTSGPINIVTVSDLSSCVDPVTNETLKFEPVKESLEVGQRPSYKAETTKGRVYFATFDDSLHLSTYLKEDAEEGVEQSVADFNPRAFRAGEEPTGDARKQPQRNVTQEEIDERTDRNNIDGGPIPPGEFAGHMEEKKRQEQEAKKSSKKEAKEERKEEKSSSKSSGFGSAK
jgi:hypothetical protein